MKILLENLEILRLQVSDFLNIVLIENSVLFLNFWSIIHFLSGGLIFYLIIKQKIKKQFYLLFTILVLYEIIEILFINSGSQLFLVETTSDTIWDLIYGMLGGLLVYKFMKKY